MLRKSIRNLCTLSVLCSLRINKTLIAVIYLTIMNDVHICVHKTLANNTEMSNNINLEYYLKRFHQKFEGTSMELCQVSLMKNRSMFKWSGFNTIQRFTRSHICSIHF